MSSSGDIIGQAPDNGMTRFMTTFAFLTTVRKLRMSESDDASQPLFLKVWGFVVK